jgi:hypothetical protein
MNCKTHEHAKYLLVVLRQIHDTIVRSRRFEMALLRHSLDINIDFYPTSSECSLPISIQSMRPPALTKFICLLIDEKSFLAFSNQNQMPLKKMRKCIAALIASPIEIELLNTMLDLP